VIVVYNKLNKKTEAAWSDVIHALKSDALPVTILCRFCVVDYEEDEYDFEYHGIPTLLEQDIIHTKGIVQLVGQVVQRKASPKTAPAFPPLTFLSWS
jgi:hypothetical protein